MPGVPLAGGIEPGNLVPRFTVPVIQRSTQEKRQVAQWLTGNPEERVDEALERTH